MGENESSSGYFVVLVWHRCFLLHFPRKSPNGCIQ